MIDRPLAVPLQLLLTASVLLVGPTRGAPSVSPHASYYASPNGSPIGSGSLAKPWDLATALAGAEGKVQPGDTIWLRGGTYHGPFRPSVSGAPGNPVVVRQYRGERAVIEGGGSTDLFHVTGPWAVYWGFELADSDQGRTARRPNMVANYADHTKYIDLVVHDGGFGFYTEPTHADVEIVGCLIYNNGFDSIVRPDGHALYLKSFTGPVVARDNIMFDQFGYGMHEYTNAGTGGLSHITLEGNVSFNNGSVSLRRTQRSANLLVGGRQPVTGGVVRDNMLYYSDGLGDVNTVLGIGSTVNDDLQFTSNYVVGARHALRVGHWNTVTVSGNTFVGANSVVQLEDGAVAGYHWTGNTYLHPPRASAWSVARRTTSLDDWRASTGLGAGDRATASLPTVPRVFVRPSPYEAGRANVIVYNWGNRPMVVVDLDGVLRPGDRYEVRDAQDFFGPPVAIGVYRGGPVSLPMPARPAPAPIGGSIAPPTTGPFFDVFVVMRAG